ncbi:MAG: HIT family protein [Candidatus Woesearchaeota archaeon]
MASIFTKIIDKEIPAHILYEDKQFIAILDAHPNTKGHTLLIPKIEVASIIDLPEPYLRKMMPIASEIAHMLERKLNCKSFNFEINDGPIAGQEVAHVHLHIIPRYNKKERIVERKNHNDKLENIHSLLVN